LRPRHRPGFLTTLQKNDYYRFKVTFKSPSVTRALKNLGALTSTSFREAWVYPPEKLEKVLVAFGVVFFLIFLTRGIRRYRSLPALEGEQIQRENHLQETLAREKLLLRYCFYWIAVPVFMMMLSELLNIPQSPSGPLRHPDVGAITLLVAVSLRHLPQNRFGRCVRWGYGIFFLIGFLTQAFYPGPGVRDTLYYVQKHYQPGDCVLLWSGGSRRYAFSLYGMPYMHHKGSEDDDNETRADDPPHILEQIQAASLGYQRIWLFMDKAEDEKETFLSVLDSYPREFESFDEHRVRKTVVKGYRCLSISHAANTPHTPE
jgi:hypothetical protein